MNTFKQLVREFWIPFLLAVAWTAFNIYATPQDRNLAGAIKIFGASFFLISWATGQFVRVSRQARTEKGLASVESRLIGLTSNLEDVSKHLISTFTGGESFAYLAMTNMGANVFSPVVIQSGNYPLSNVTVRICDLNHFQANAPAGNFLASYQSFSVGEMAPKVACGSGIEFVAATPQQDWNVFFSARNGFWTQLIRGRLIGTDWRFASVVTRQGGSDTKPLYVSIPDGFPMIGDPQFDDAERQPGVVTES